MSGATTVYGAHYSVYTRIVRLALEEKSADYDFVEVDIFSDRGVPEGYGEHQPFGRIPAFEHDGFRLYEAGAIARYIDDVFEGPGLQPTEPKLRARMNQIISIMDAYAYRTLVWDIFFERVRQPERGLAPDEDKIAVATPKAKTVLRELARLKHRDAWMAGPAPSLADCHVGPMLTLFCLAEEGRALMGETPGLIDWLGRFAARPSALATRFPIEAS